MNRGLRLTTDENTCLMEATENNREEVVDLLPAKNKWGNTALHFACRGNVAILGKLLAAPGVQFNEKTMWGMTPIMLAIAHGQTDAAQMIADIDEVNLQVKKSFVMSNGNLTTLLS